MDAQANKGKEGKKGRKKKKEAATEGNSLNRVMGIGNDYIVTMSSSPM